MDIRKYNQQAWDHNVEQANEWTVPVSHEIVEAARRGDWRIYLTPILPVPRDWFPDSLQGVRILALGSGGGQQGPVLAAAGADVTVFDNSPRQLAQDTLVAEREGLELRTVEGDMADLSALQAGSFDLIINPVSNVFVPHVAPVWLECHRVLRTGGVLMTGFMNPAFYLFDHELMDNEGKLVVRHKLPYSDTDAPPEELARIVEKGWPLEFSHSLDDQIGSQLKAGFVLTGLYEDRDPRTEIRDVFPIYIVTRAVKCQGWPCQA